MDTPITSPLTPFSWVAKRDGRLVPFEADRICHALFGASETLGRPDPFLARELTDVILHFLAAEASETTPTTAAIAEVVIKVLRELGQHALARTYAAGKPGPAAAASLPQDQRPAWREHLAAWVEAADAPVPLVWRAGSAALREFSQEQVFSRDLIAAHRAGLITLTGLEAPRELAACVLGPEAVGCGPWAVGQRLLDAVEEARHAAGVFLAIDSPEYGIAHCPQTPVEYTRDLLLALKANGLPAVLNLNCATPPRWADDLAEGPLFADFRQSPTPEHLADLAGTLLEELVLRHRRQTSVRIDWHLGDTDLATVDSTSFLRAARWAAAGSPVAFTLDRPRKPVRLAEGLNRTSPALLLTVQLDLTRLFEILPAPVEPEVYLHKLGSLARLPLSAGVQKREFLRRRCGNRPALTRGFLLDRASLLIAPQGLESLVQRLLGMSLFEDKRAVEFGRRVVERLRAVLTQDGPACQLGTCLDLATLAAPAAGDRTGESVRFKDPEQQLRLASQLQEDGGSTKVWLAHDAALTAESLIQGLRFAWEKTELQHVCYARHEAPAAQRVAVWPAEAESA